MVSLQGTGHLGQVDFDVGIYGLQAAIHSKYNTFDALEQLSAYVLLYTCILQVFASFIHLVAYDFTSIPKMCQDGPVLAG